MSDLYKTAEIEGGTILFAERCQEVSFLHKLTGSTEVEEVMTSKEKLLSKVLLPMTFDPISKAFMVYETIRVLLIFITMFIVPIEVRTFSGLRVHVHFR